MQTLFLSLIIAFNTAFTTPTKDAPTIEKKHIYQHWVISTKETNKKVIVYRPYHMAEAKGIELRHKYAGMVIKKGGKLRQLRWVMCGNDKGPSGYDYKWKLKTDNENEAFLIIKKKATYKVLALTKDMLKLERVNNSK